MASYLPAEPINCEVEPDLKPLAGKTAIVTGGATGIGEAYVRALAAANVTVVIGDRNASAGQKLTSEPSRTKFVQCDVTEWDDQARLFKEAAAISPSGKIHYVIANAGITNRDDVFSFDGADQGPHRPDLKIIDVNLKGVLYTAKLAMHYFVLQNGQTPRQSQEDTCLILISSGAGFLDVPRSPQYCSTKWAIRGIMHSLRRTAFYYGSRINVIAPWYVRTNILSEEEFNAVQAAGVEFARAEDAAECALRIFSDKTIHGKSLFICPRKWAPRGYRDLDLEEYRGDQLLDEIQVDQIRPSPVELGLSPE